MARAWPSTAGVVAMESARAACTHEANHANCVAVLGAEEHHAQDDDGKVEHVENTILTREKLQL